MDNTRFQFDFFTKTAHFLVLLAILSGLSTTAVAQPTVTLTLIDSMASEVMQDSGSFSVNRSGDDNTNEALVVLLSVGGTALRDIDYARVGLDWTGGEAFYVTIPAGELSQLVIITPYQDNEAEAEETASFMLLELGNEYILGAETSASISIENNADRVFTNSFDRPNPMLPIDVSFTFSLEDEVSAIIGPEGGSLNSQGPDASAFELTIPAGAVQQPITITMTPITALLPGPFTESLAPSFTAGVHFEPDGMVFLQPLTLTVVPTGGVEDSTWAWSYREDGKSLHPVPFVTNGVEASIGVSHFSGTGISLNWSEAVQSFGNFAAQTAEQIAVHNIGNVVANPVCDENGCAIDELALINIFLDWYIAGVRPMLVNAKSNPDLAKPALRQWLSWLAEIQKWGLDDQGALDNLLSEADNFAKLVIDAAFSAAITKCDGAGSKQEALADLVEPLDWITTAQMLGYDNEYPFSEIEKCATIKVSDASYPPRLDNTESGELKVRVGLLFRGLNGSTRYDMDSAVTLTSTGIASAPSSGSPDNDGWFISTLTMDSEEDATVDLNASVSFGVGYQSEAEQSYTIKPKTSLSLQGKPVSGGAYSDTVEIEPAESADVQATVFFEAAPSSGKTVEFALNGPGSLTFASALTDGNGLANTQFQAPNEAGQSTITASHTTDDAKLLEDTITISYGAAVTISPVAALVNAGGTVEFTATTINLSPAKVTWSATAGSTIQSTGDLTATWTAPLDAGEYTITATSVADNSVKGAASATVELSAEPTGQFAEGFYYGRQLEQCEYEPGSNDGEPPGHCERNIAFGYNSRPAWMRIHSDNGPTVVEFHTQGTEACGWVGNLNITPPWLRCSTYYPHFFYRAWYEYLILSVGTIGSTTTLPPQGDIRRYINCYNGCLSSSFIIGSFWDRDGVIKFSQDSVIVIQRPDDDISVQRRWIFVKDEQRDPFGEWAFDPISLETPEEYRSYR